MFWTIIIHKDPDSDYGVTVPGLPGCYSAGNSYEDALINAREAIELHLEGLQSEGMAIPTPPPVEEQLAKKDTDSVLGLIELALVA